MGKPCARSTGKRVITFGWGCCLVSRPNVGVDEGRDEGEEVGQDAHRSGDRPVDLLAGDEHAPEPVGEDVHAPCMGLA